MKRMRLDYATQPIQSSILQNELKFSPKRNGEEEEGEGEKRERMRERKKRREKYVCLWEIFKTILAPGS